MGSGGPRGLQILLSGGSAVRGGFDSHTFPPPETTGRPRRSGRPRCLRPLAGWALAALAGSSAVADAGAKEAADASADSVAAADSLLAPADSLAGSADSLVVPVRLDPAAPLGDTVAVTAAADPAGSPKRGFFRSPTGVMLRSLVLPGWGQATNEEWVKAGLVAAVEGYLIYTLVRDNNRLSELDPATLEYANLENQRNANAWWLGGAVFLSMVDAYVGAHLKGIEVRIGPEPETQGVRVGLRREF